MKTTLIALLSLFLFAFTCEKDSKVVPITGLEADTIEAVEAAGVKAEDFKGNIDNLLTLEMASQVSGLSAADAVKKHSTTIIESVIYEWKSDRTREIEISKGNPMKIPMPNSVELSWVKNTTLKQFKHDYHNPTPEEIKRAEAAMDQKLKELEAEGKTTKESSDVSGGIAKNSISKFSVEEVPNLGDYAVFVNSGMMGVSTRDIKVFYRGLSFTLEVNLSDDQSYNDKKSVELARMIVEQKLK